MNIILLKERYGELAKKHKLPLFEELNSFFDIEQIDKESDMLIRVIRRIMVDRIDGNIRLLESLMIPGNPSPAFMVFTRNLTNEDRKVMQEVYKSLTGLVLEAMGLENGFDESGEVVLIKKIAGEWPAISEKMKSIISAMGRNTVVDKREKGYYG